MITIETAQNVKFKVASPLWHEDILKEREKAVEDGSETFTDWERAKKEIRKSLYHENQNTRSRSGDLKEGFLFYEKQEKGLGEYFLNTLFSDIRPLSKLRFIS